MTTFPPPQFADHAVDDDHRRRRLLRTGDEGVAGATRSGTRSKRAAVAGLALERRQGGSESSPRSIEWSGGEPPLSAGVMPLAVTPADAEYLCTAVGLGGRGNSDAERCRWGLPPSGSRRCRPFRGCHGDRNVGGRRRHRVVGRRNGQRRLGQRFYLVGRSPSLGALGCHVGGTRGSARRGWRGAEGRGGRGGRGANWVGGPRTSPPPASPFERLTAVHTLPAGWGRRGLCARAAHDVPPKPRQYDHERNRARDV